MTTLKEFDIPVTFELNDAQIREAHAALNKHYTGDEECNILVDGEYVSKYPLVEQQIPEYPASHYAVSRSYHTHVKVELLEDGTLRLKKKKR